jgi:muconate cycloisomerase
MIIEEITVHQVELPFSREFAHARKRRHSAKNVVVEVVADSGTVRGYGEGAPRPYVTGESQAGAAEDVLSLLKAQAFSRQIDRVATIWRFVDSLPQGKEHNAAICALELALLDALGTSQGIPVTDYFPREFWVDAFRYGAAIPLGIGRGVFEISTLIKNLGMYHLRIKMGSDIARNRQALEQVRAIFGNDYDLRVDANGAWSAEKAFDHLDLMAEYAVKVIEDPMEPTDRGIAAFARQAERMGFTLMADESVCSLVDLERTIGEGHFGMINVRVSKCGGLRRSLQIIQRLREKGLSFQIGCQLGESGLLSAAGRALGLMCGDAVYYDGSYDAFLLAVNITCKNVSFDAGGYAGALEGPGLGVSVDRSVLERLSSSSRKVVM